MTTRKPLPRPLALDPFTVGDAIATGVGAGRLRGRDLERPFHGVRVDPASVEEVARFGSFPNAGASEEFAGLIARCRAYAPLLRPGQFFSHETAARLFKCPLPSRFSRDDPLHVSVLAPGRAPRSKGVTGHQAIAGTIVQRFGLPVSDAATTWLSLGASLDLDDLVAAGDHLVLDPAVLDPYDIRPHVSIAKLQDRLVGFSGAGARNAREAVGQVRQGSESRAETLLRLVLVRAGLPEPELNVDIYDAAGRWLGRADQYFREWRVISEYDGDEHRTNSRQYDRDITRIEEFARAGHTVVRIRKLQLFVHPELAVERVSRALRDSGWPG